ncbi:hypothetical protein PQQ65_29535 [Paraburkholderia strydomiana]|jgi:hypothetical protein|uniref:hypothetical protein n=1 Tax=Paraburkholderia strydomiana TaxID=1245417 RepID=UPI0038BCA3CB
MEIVEITVEYPSGMVVTDQTTFSRELGQVFPSERLASLLREFGASEAPPVVTALIDGLDAPLDHCVDGSFSVRASVTNVGRKRSLTWLGKAWSKDQRQQFGRFCHALTVASLVGVVGYWHSTSTWTWGAILNEAALTAIIVLTFIVGMFTMDGE